MKAIGIIPARLGSTRLSEKVLKSIAGKPMIQHVWERAKQAALLEEVLIACDDERVRSCADHFGAKAVMTRKDHPNGTSRVAEAASQAAADVVINIQGDEPMIHPEAVDQLASVLLRNPEVQIATLAVRQTGPEVYQNPNVVKVVCDAQGKALYFSRSPLPYFRQSSLQQGFLKHLGIYGYRKTFLLDFIRWPQSELEKAEQLEQLRVLERGVPISIVETQHDSLSVDVAEDLDLVEMKLKAS